MVCIMRLKVIAKNLSLDHHAEGLPETLVECTHSEDNLESVLVPQTCSTVSLRLDKEFDG